MRSMPHAHLCVAQAGLRHDKAGQLLQGDSEVLVAARQIIQDGPEGEDELVREDPRGDAHWEPHGALEVSERPLPSLRRSGPGGGLQPAFAARPHHELIHRFVLLHR